VLPPKLLGDLQGGGDGLVLFSFRTIRSLISTFSVVACFMVVLLILEDKIAWCPEDTLFFRRVGISGGCQTLHNVDEKAYEKIVTLDGFYPDSIFLSNFSRSKIGLPDAGVAVFNATKIRGKGYSQSEYPTRG
jgi:hypothetical protein